jgi:hypothetical protein
LDAGLGNPIWLWVGVAFADGNGTQAAMMSIATTNTTTAKYFMLSPP